jgi:hypothetical protein
MKTIKIFFVCLSICGISGSISGQVSSKGKMISVPVETIQDKIRGGLLGQILGDLNGLPHENNYINEPGDVKNYIPSLSDGAWTDDDTDFEWFYICEMQKSRNVFLSADYITKLWKERVNRGVYCSNRFARYLMDIGFKPPYTGYTTFNPWATFNLSGQFLCETYGLVAPGMPQTAAKIGLNYTTVAINNEPAQATQLFTTMISTAFMENDINKIIEAGFVTLDKTSILVQVINDIKNWHAQNLDNWRETRRLLKEKYTREEGRDRDRNGHEINTGCVIAALLYGKGDFVESEKSAFNFGWDADCNAATVGTIVGVTYGYRRMMHQNDRYNPEWQIVDRYKNTTRDNMPMDETITSFADRIIELFEMVNESNGGVKSLVNNNMVYQIPIESPAQVIKLTPVENQKQLLRKEFGKQINEDLVNGNKEERARAVYMAICLDLNTDLAKNNPKEWSQACADLSGYWKIMNNVFYDSFQDLKLFHEKFKMAGFKKPARKYSDAEIYNDKVFWKDPSELK